MNEVLKIIVSLSISGTLLILILYLFRLFFKNRLSKQWQYYIWLVVIIRLLLPFAPDTNLMSVLFQKVDRGTKQVELATLPTKQSYTTIPQVESLNKNIVDEQDDFKDYTQQNTIDNTTSNMVLTIKQNFWFIWLAVVLILLIRKITVYQSFVKYIKAGCVEIVDIDLLERFGKIVEQNNVKVTLELYTNNLVSSPLLIGFFRPCIVLPSTNLSEIDFKYTILHELTHYKRYDMFYKWLVQFTICLHWFNPVVYLMAHEIERNCELSCDEVVIRVLSADERHAYGNTLINAMGMGGLYKDSIASMTLSESKELLKERLDAIMKFKKTNFLTATVSIALAFILCCGATVSGAYSINTVSSKTVKSKETTPYSIYSQYGISYNKNTDTLFYNNEPIRYFEDNSIIYNGDDTISGSFDLHIDKTNNGKIDVYAIHNHNNELTGVRIANEEEFTEKTYAGYSTNDDISKYKQYGISADAVGGIYFENSFVREIYDDVTGTYITQSRGASFPKDSIDIIATYNNNQLSGFRKATKEEYDANTQRRVEAVQNYWVEQHKQQSNSSLDSNLTLVTKEYSIEDIKSLNISGVVIEALSENVSVTKGGETLKVEYYIESQNDYTLQNESDGGGTFEELVLRRVTSTPTTESTISITIPDNVDFKLISVTTINGDINLENCTGENIFSQTQRGDVIISGGGASSMFKVETVSGNALISDLYTNQYGTSFSTESGTITFKAKDDIQNYCFILDTGVNAQLKINGKIYGGGDYKINPSATKEIYFDSPNGSLIVENLKTISPNNNIVLEQLTSKSNVGLTLVRKEYTIDDLEQLGITGLFINALEENIVVNQGTSSLILEYYQEDSTDYTLGTRDYEFIRGEFVTPEDIELYGGKSGIAKEIALQSSASTTTRTIYVTLPNNPKYNRAVQIYSENGNIQMNQCSSTAMLDMGTKIGNISVQNCSSPQLGVETQSGDINVDNCSMKKLNSKTTSGTFSLQLADSIKNYKVSIDTYGETEVIINGKSYQGGEFTLNENASKSIIFDCYKGGSFIVTDNTQK